MRIKIHVIDKIHWFEDNGFANSELDKLWDFLAPELSFVIFGYGNDNKKYDIFCEASDMFGMAKHNYDFQSSIYSLMITSVLDRDNDIEELYLCRMDDRENVIMIVLYRNSSNPRNRKR